MKGKVMLVGLLVCFLSSAVLAMGGPAPSSSAGNQAGGAMEGVFLIDDFESGSIRSPREWWTFDISQSEIVDNAELTFGNKEVAAQAGEYSFLLKGTANNWYAGGCGAYIAKEKQDLSKYNSFQLDIYGNGPGSGTLKIELFDDDNKNWQAEQDPAQNYVPVYDDKYVYDVRVDWRGWKRVVIPFDDFVDDNAGVGDDAWNPQQAGGSGGLLQFQFICIGAKDSADINFNLDNVSLTESEE
ncbi:hypothetical protein ACFL5U_00150 [Candidatus Margulisiibacteriota bacterium]